jgi:HTH-type transcriptional regulator, transcriptional repressor of NAD biosynthesis genes
MVYKSTGLVVGKFAPFHSGHKFVINTALEKMDTAIVLVYSNPDFPDMPMYVRANWIRQIYKDKPVYVFTPENSPSNDATDFTHREFVKNWLGQHHSILPFGSKNGIDVVYGSDDYIPGFAKHIGANHHMVDAKRSKYNISGTKVRECMKLLESKTGINENAQWLYDEKGFYDFPPVPELVEREFRFWLQPIKRIVFLGAESTGKSTLAEYIAKEFSMPFVAEYGREYYEKKGGELDLQDYVEIAKEHRRLEDKATIELAKKLNHYVAKGSSQLPSSDARGYLFIDTNAITTLFFSYYYNQGGLSELHTLANDCKSRYHHVFVCADDIPFEQDGWRDNNIWRGRMQGMVLHDLDCRGVHYTVVHGNVEKRVHQVKTVLAGGGLEQTTITKHLGPKPLTISS